MSGAQEAAPGGRALRPDSELVGAYWDALVRPGDTHEIRIPKTRRGPARLFGTTAGYFTDRAAAIRAVLPVTGLDAPAVYVTLNPVAPDLRARANNRLVTGIAATTSDDNVTRRRHVLFDFDPVRASETSATDAERDAARAYLDDRGWPVPLVDAMTGNGGGLVYRVALPNDEASTDLVIGCLEALAALFDTPSVEIDHAVYNPARVTKLLGTVAAKGDDCPDLGREWRLATGTLRPDAGVVPRELLEDLARLRTDAEDTASRRNGVTFGPVRAGRTRAWTVAEVLTRNGIGWREQRRRHGVAYCLDRCLTSTQHDDGAAIIELASGALDYHCHHKSCRGKGWNDVRAVLGLDDAAQGRSAAGSTPWTGTGSLRVAEAPWPEPLAGEADYGLVGQLVRSIEPHSEADPAAILAHVVTGLGACIGPQVHAIAGDAPHPARLNAVVVGETAIGRKGSAHRATERGLALADHVFVAERMTEGLSSGEGLIWQVRDPIYRREKVAKGSDAAYEDVLVDAGVEDKRLWVVESEFASVLLVAQREGNTLTAIVRRAWDRGDIRSLTKTNPARATGAHISIVGHVSRDELLRYLDRSELASGFANRFLFVAARRARILPEGEGVPLAALGRLAPVIQEVAAWAAAPRLVVRDDEARAIWADVYESLSEGKPGLFGAATNRAAAQVLRLSVLYAALDCSAVMTADHLMAALAVWRYAEQSARWVFSDALGDPTADAILGALRRGGPLTRNDLVNLFDRHINRARIDRALGLLLAAGLARREEKRDTGGRPAEVWHAV